MSIVLRPDDIEVGQFITVLHSESITAPGVHIEPYSDIKGMPMMVAAVDLPFVLVNHLARCGNQIIDVRRADLKLLSDSYVAACRSICCQPEVNVAIINPCDGESQVEKS